MIAKTIKYIVIFGILVSCSSIATDLDYRLGPGDTIVVSVYGEQDLFREIRVNKSGKFSYPFIGDIELLGKTTNELALSIDKGLRGDYLINPQVSVSIKSYRPFFINGEVVKPGGYPYQDGLTLDKAIALAGGLTPRASKSDWSITRKKTGGGKDKFKADINSGVKPDDIIHIGQSFF